MSTSQTTQARELLLQTRVGVLSTISVKLAGYPYGSVVPYCLDRAGRPLLLISEIAQHTKNIVANPKLSLTVRTDGQPDVQANARITYMGQAHHKTTGEADFERYYRYFPNSLGYHEAHDFNFYYVTATQIYYIGGFGQIHWIDPEAFLKPNPFSAQEEKQIVDHMNTDHQQALHDYLKIYKSIETTGVNDIMMVGIDSEGFDIRVNDHFYRFHFTSEVHTLDAARKAMVQLARG